ncbi:MAG: pyridoxal 5'-phosphate synthase glutaminase subunit PdxT [Anaerolineales bacterium]|nr:pyridoxal 5'-phosphate synthase glutaminase subunit PdxT [Anaerolineales bacterium]
MQVGVLAVQGAFLEHRIMLETLGISNVEVRLPKQLEDLDGLIIPGGESTTIGKLCVDYNLLEPLRAFGRKKAVWGTCAGAIFLSKQAHRDQPLLGLMDTEIDRNAFGRQVDSFEVDLLVDDLENQDQPFRAVFIRAPLISSTGSTVRTLARIDPYQNRPGGIVAARQDKLLATVFHPELTNDTRFHQYFIRMIEETNL